METIKKNELFSQIVEVVKSLPLKGGFDKYQPILNKHDADNINLNISEKISSIGDPLERAVVSIYFLDTLNRVNDIDEEDLLNIRSNHNNLLRMIMHLNCSVMDQTHTSIKSLGEIDKELKAAKDNFDQYIANFK
jgi:hypothetical protein